MNESRRRLEMFGQHFNSDEDYEQWCHAQAVLDQLDEVTIETVRKIADEVRNREV